MLILYFENSTFGVVMSWSGRVAENGPVYGPLTSPVTRNVVLQPLNREAEMSHTAACRRQITRAATP